MREYTQPRIGFCLLAGALAGFVNGFFGAAGGVLAGLLFRKMPARALHLILGGVILAGGIRLIVC